MNIFRNSAVFATITTLALTARAHGWGYAAPTRYGRVMMIQPMGSLFDGPCTTATNRCRENGVVDPTTEFFKTMDQVFEKATRMDPNSFRQRMMRRKDQVKAGIRYEVTDTDEELKIAFDVPGVSVDDIDILLENDGKILTVRGKRESKSDGYTFNSNFSKSFYVDQLVDIDQIKAQLENGVLIVSAPKDASKLQEQTKKIPITVTSSSSTTTSAETKESDTNSSEDNVSEDILDIDAKQDDNIAES